MGTVSERQPVPQERLVKEEEEDKAAEESDEHLADSEIAVLQAACQVKLVGGHAANVTLGAARTWADVRRALEQASFNALADVLRGHCQPECRRFLQSSGRSYTKKSLKELLQLRLPGPP